MGIKVRRRDGIYQATPVWDPPTNIVGSPPNRMEWEKLEITQRIYDGCDCYPWRRTFVIWPCRTITGKPLFLKWAYKRKFWAVWGSGFHMEPVVEYATILEVLTDGI